MISSSAAPKLSQAERIRRATEKSVRARNLYADQTASELTQSLKSAQDGVAKSILQYKTLGSLPDNKLAALKGLEKLNGEISDILSTLKKDHTVAFRKATKAAFKQGLYDGIGEFATAQMPLYRDLTPAGIEKLGTRVFTLVDTDALDFMTNYNVILAGDVHRELADGIKRTIMSGIATGKGADDIVRDLGSVIVDKDSFRQAGTRVFSKAQYRMEMIARTEVLRAHNQGRIKFHQRVGIQKMEWLAMEDERMCPVCGALDGKVFPTDQFPQQPAHPNCRCVGLPAWPLDICGINSKPTAKADDEPTACVLPPQTLEKLADAKAEEEAKLKSAFESGQISDLNNLTVKQLQTLAKQNGIAIARTKVDFLKLLDDAEPGIHHGDLSGEALKAKLAQYKIGALRSKEDLVALLAQKQAAVKQAVEVAQQVSKLPPASGLSDLTVKDLQEMAKGKGISLNMTKQDVIDLLDQVEPGIDHSGLSGQALIAAKQKHGIGVLKNKQQLVQALEKVAGQALAEKAKQEALDAAKTQALQKAQGNIQGTMAKVVLPPAPEGYAAFLASVQDAEVALSFGTGLPQQYLETQATELALKKKLWQGQIEKLDAKILKDLAKKTKVKNWQWGAKQDFITIFTETDPVKLQSVQDKLTAGYQAHQAKYGKKGGKPAASPAPKPAPHVSSSKPAHPPVTPLAGVPDFAVIDESWEKDRGKPGNFTFEKSAKDAGGVHQKEFWLDPNGDRWMFKPADLDFLAHAEEMAYRVGRLVDPEAIEVRVITLNGRIGTIQKMKTGLRRDYDFRDLTDMAGLAQGEIEQLQREHVIDWFISNHDNHAQQFIRTTDGRIYGVDKGQAGKFFGKPDEKLAIGYNPNHNYGPLESMYDKLFRAAKAGQVSVDPNLALKYIEAIERIPESEYLAALRTYAKKLYFPRGGDLRVQQYLDSALSRKRNIRADFERFYGDVLNDKSFKFGRLDLPKVARDEFAEAVSQVSELGWQGKTLKIDTEDIEDQNVLTFEQILDRTGQAQTVLEFKLRPDAARKMLDAILRLQNTGSQDLSPFERVKLECQELHGKILPGVKTIAHHISQGDRNFNTVKLNAALDTLPRLEALLKSESPDTEQYRMAAYYRDVVQMLKDIQANKPGVALPPNYRFRVLTLDDDKLQRELAPFSPKPVEKAKPKVAKGDALVTSRTIRDGKLHVVGPPKTNKEVITLNNYGLSNGSGYTVSWDDGVDVKFRPDSDDNPFTQRGYTEVTISGKPDPKRVREVLDRVNEFAGVRTHKATPEEEELLYLIKMADMRRQSDKLTIQSSDGSVIGNPLLSATDEWQSLLRELDARNASVPERVAALRDYWTVKLGDPKKLPAYSPASHESIGYPADKLRGGYGRQLRWDLTEKQLDKAMEKYTVYHSTVGVSDDDGRSVHEFIDTVLGSNGHLVSTFERFRLGIPVTRGASCAKDMHTGGSSYVFTRIKPRTAQESTCGLYFKNRVLMRMDAISYYTDEFGKVSEGNVARKRLTGVDGLKQAHKRRDNETIFKQSINILEEIDRIVVPDAQRRDLAIQAFRKHGITNLPDGRPIEQVVFAVR